MWSTFRSCVSFAMQTTPYVNPAELLREWLVDYKEGEEGFLHITEGRLRPDKIREVMSGVSVGGAPLEFESSHLREVCASITDKKLSIEEASVSFRTPSGGVEVVATVSGFCAQHATGSSELQGVAAMVQWLRGYLCFKCDRVAVRVVSPSGDELKLNLKICENLSDAALRVEDVTASIGGQEVCSLSEFVLRGHNFDGKNFTLKEASIQVTQRLLTFLSQCFVHERFMHSRPCAIRLRVPELTSVDGVVSAVTPITLTISALPSGPPTVRWADVEQPIHLLNLACTPETPFKAILSGAPSLVLPDIDINIPLNRIHVQAVAIINNEETCCVWVTLAGLVASVAVEAAAEDALDRLAFGNPLLLNLVVDDGSSEEDEELLGAALPGRHCPMQDFVTVEEGSSSGDVELYSCLVGGADGTLASCIPTEGLGAMGGMSMEQVFHSITSKVTGFFGPQDEAETAADPAETEEDNDGDEEEDEEAPPLIHTGRIRVQCFSTPRVGLEGGNRIGVELKVPEGVRVSKTLSGGFVSTDIILTAETFNGSPGALQHKPVTAALRLKRVGLNGEKSKVQVNVKEVSVSVGSPGGVAVLCRTGLTAAEMSRAVAVAVSVITGAFGEAPEAAAPPAPVPSPGPGLSFRLDSLEINLPDNSHTATVQGVAVTSPDATTLAVQVRNVRLLEGGGREVVVVYPQPAGLSVLDATVTGSGVEVCVGAVEVRERPTMPLLTALDPLLKAATPPNRPATSPGPQITVCVHSVDVYIGRIASDHAAELSVAGIAIAVSPLGTAKVELLSDVKCVVRPDMLQGNESFPQGGTEEEEEEESASGLQPSLPESYYAFDPEVERPVAATSEAPPVDTSVRTPVHTVWASGITVCVMCEGDILTLEVLSLRMAMTAASGSVASAATFRHVAALFNKTVLGGLTDRTDSPPLVALFLKPQARVKAVVQNMPSLKIVFSKEFIDFCRRTASITGGGGRGGAQRPGSEATHIKVVVGPEPVTLWLGIPGGTLSVPVLLPGTAGYVTPAVAASTLLIKNILSVFDFSRTGNAIKSFTSYLLAPFSSASSSGPFSQPEQPAVTDPANVSEVVYMFTENMDTYLSALEPKG